jgi:hypothetical protein
LKRGVIKRTTVFLKIAHTAFWLHLTAVPTIGTQPYQDYTRCFFYAKLSVGMPENLILAFVGTADGANNREQLN